MAFFNRRQKVLFSYRDYELIYRPRRKGQFLPRIQLQKIPPRPLGLGPMTSSVDGPMDKEFAGFPFTTNNKGSMQVLFPRLGSSMRLSIEDPVTAASSDSEEEVQKTLEAAYDQKVPGVGDVTVRARANGEWGASFAREVEDLGKLTGNVNSQLDWNLDLEQSYPAFKGMATSASYGATQDGMRARAKVEKELRRNLYGSYAVGNEAGQYSPAGFQHDASLTLSSGKGHHVLEAQGTYNRKFNQVPVRGSLQYRAQLRPVALEASVDFDRYHLRAKASHAQIAAAVDRVEKDGVRPAEVELRLGKASATALLGGDRPRLRLAWS